MCGVDLEGAELQGANLMSAQLQGAALNRAQLQGAHLFTTYLQGAYLECAQLQGANLSWAMLQGACLVDADLSVLPKGFLLPKNGSLGGETEATKEDRPTDLHGADLSVLAFTRGTEYHRERHREGMGCELTGAKAIGAGAHLSGANFTGAYLKDATLKDTTFATHQPPERPASGFLCKSWRAKAVVGSVVRAAMAAADEDDDDSDDGSDDDDDDDNEEEENEEEENDFVDNLATAAQDFMHTVGGVVGSVEELLKSSMLKGSLGELLITDADNYLAELLCKKLETANDKQAAIFVTLSTHIVSPLFDQHLPKVLEDALTNLAQQVAKAGEAATAASDADAAADAAAGATTTAAVAMVQKQLLDTFKTQVLGAGKATLLKRLKPIVSKFAGAVFSKKGLTLLDEEQAVLRPKESATRLVQELWKALRASLDTQARAPMAHRSPHRLALPSHTYTHSSYLQTGTPLAQVSDAIVSCALAPLGRAGKSVRRFAKRLNHLEDALCSEFRVYSSAEAGANSKKLLQRLGLTGSRGGLYSKLLKTTLTAATQYEVSVDGFSGSFDMVRLAWTCSRAKLTKHENELEYLKEKLKKLEEMKTTEKTWRDVSESWQAVLAMIKTVEVERGSAVLQCIASDEKLLKALGMAKTLYKIKGDVPTEVVIQLNDGAGAHIRTHAYTYDKLISLELVRIQRVKDIQLRFIQLSATMIGATMIGTATLLSRLYYDVLESGDSRLAVLLPIGAVAGLLLLPLISVLKS